MFLTFWKNFSAGVHKCDGTWRGLLDLSLLQDSPTLCPRRLELSPTRPRQKLAKTHHRACSNGASDTGCAFPCDRHLGILGTIPEPATHFCLCAMDNKRKSSGSNEPGPADGEDRAAKRRKVCAVLPSRSCFWRPASLLKADNCPWLVCFAENKPVQGWCRVGTSIVPAYVTRPGFFNSNPSTPPFSSIQQSSSGHCHSGTANKETRLQHQISQALQSFDLYKGESPESTTAYGLSFLEQIRRTTDKKYAISHAPLSFQPLGYPSASRKGLVAP